VRVARIDNRMCFIICIINENWFLIVASGVLACLDGFMNIALEQTEEYVDGQLKARYGDCFIRGNNGENTHLCANKLCMF
jgi:hypothetical protein